MYAEHAKIVPFKIFQINSENQTIRNTFFYLGILRDPRHGKWDVSLSRQEDSSAFFDKNREIHFFKSLNHEKVVFLSLLTKSEEYHGISGSQWDREDVHYDPAVGGPLPGQIHQQYHQLLRSHQRQLHTRWVYLLLQVWCWVSSKITWITGLQIKALTCSRIKTVQYDWSSEIETKFLCF